MKFCNLRYCLLFLTAALFGQVEYQECLSTGNLPALYSSFSTGQSVLVPEKVTSGNREYKLIGTQCESLGALFLPEQANVLSFSPSSTEHFVVSEYYDSKAERLFVFKDVFKTEWHRDTLVNLAHSSRMDRDKHLSPTLESVISKLQLDNGVGHGDLRVRFLDSPDHSQKIIYTMESRGEQSKMLAWRFDTNWEKLGEVSLTIDRGYTLSGVDVDNQGNVYLLKYNNAGEVGVVRCSIAKEVSYQAISGTNSQKDNIRLIHLADDSFGVLKLSKKSSGELNGLVFTPLSFKGNSVQSVHTELRLATTNALESRNDFHLAKILNGRDGGIYVFLERRSISINGGEFKDFTQIERPSVLSFGQILTGDVVVFKLDEEGRERFQLVVTKHQLSNLSQGINETSFEAWEDGGSLYVLRSGSKGGIVNSKLYLETINTTTGEFGEVSLISASKYAFQRWSFSVEGGQLKFLAKKGLVGNKLYQGKYTY